MCSSDLSEGFHASATVLLASVEQFACGCVAPCLSQRDPMNASIDLPVPFVRESMSYPALRELSKLRSQHPAATTAPKDIGNPIVQVDRYRQLTQALADRRWQTGRPALIRLSKADIQVATWTCRRKGCVTSPPVGPQGSFAPFHQSILSAPQSFLHSHEIRGGRPQTNTRESSCSPCVPLRCARIRIGLSGN